MVIDKNEGKTSPWKSELKWQKALLEIDHLDSPCGRQGHRDVLIYSFPPSEKAAVQEVTKQISCGGSPRCTGDVIGTACNSSLTCVSLRRAEVYIHLWISLRFTYNASLTFCRLRRKRSLIAPGEWMIICASQAFCGGVPADWTVILLYRGLISSYVRLLAEVRLL